MQPNSNNLASEQALANEEVSALPANGIPPGIQRSQETFLRNLPQLLHDKKSYRQWVAYRGDELIGFARSETDLYEECSRRGLKEDEFVVCYIVPEIPRDFDLAPVLDNK